VLDALAALDLERRTLVVFASDNGPWALFDEQGGSAGPLRGSKGGTFEGGIRVPALFRWPGTIAPGVVMDMGSVLDLLPTVCALTGARVPSGRVLDGFDLSAVLRGRGPGPRQDVYYYRESTLYALRHGRYKAHFFTRSEYGSDPEVAHDPPLLYDLDQDPGERYDVSSAHPDVAAALRRLGAEHERSIPRAENQLARRASP